MTIFGLVLSFSAVISLNSEVEVIRTSGCRALEVGENTFDLDGHDGLVLMLDLNSIFAKKFKKGYENDEEGGKCLSRMEKRLNLTMAAFREKVMLYQGSSDMLEVYIKHPNLHEKRSAAGVAIALSIFDLVLTGVNYVYTDYRIGQLKEKIMELDEAVNGLMSEQGVLSNNQDFLYEEGKLFGLKNNLLVDHVNSIEKIHSCDLLFLNFENRVLKLEMYLERVLDAIVNNKLTREVINFETLERLTLHDRFYDSLYRVSPMHLYKLAKIHLHSFSADKVTFILSYPVINRKFLSKTVNVLGTAESFLVNPGTEKKNFRFLVPKEMNIDAIDLSAIKSADGCLDTEGILACQNDALLSKYSLNCIELLIHGNTSKYCFRPEGEELSLSYGQHGVLISSSSLGVVYDFKTNEILEDLEGNSCTYLRKNQDLMLKTEGVEFELFQPPLVWGSKFVMQSNDNEAAFKKHENLSLPEDKNPVTYNDRTGVASQKFMLFALTRLSDPWTAASVIMICVSIPVTCIAFFCCISKFCRSGNVNVNVGVDGGMLMGV